MTEVRVAPDAVCDFCSSDEPRFLEDCETFEAQPFVANYKAYATGAWAACVTCHDLILARQWHPLQKRAVEAFLRKYPNVPKSRVQRGVELIHGQFRAHKPVGDL
jgi:hypothetical protein